MKYENEIIKFLKLYFIFYYLFLHGWKLWQLLLHNNTDPLIY